MVSATIATITITSSLQRCAYNELNVSDLIAKKREYVKQVNVRSYNVDIKISSLMYSQVMDRAIANE